MDFELSDDQLAFQATAREFAAREFAPQAAAWDAECHFPKAVIRKAGELGFCGLYSPEDVGGLGLTRLDAAIIFDHFHARFQVDAVMIETDEQIPWAHLDIAGTAWGAKTNKLVKTGATGIHVRTLHHLITGQ